MRQPSLHDFYLSHKIKSNAHKPDKANPYQQPSFKIKIVRIKFIKKWRENLREKGY